MQKRFFSIVVVALNPGERLEKTLNSIVNQTFTDYEVILKDGGSKDGSLKSLQKQGFFETYPQIRIVEQEDKGIYDAMNQAVALVRGRYVQFLNCGDLFYDEKVLEKAAECIREKENKNDLNCKIDAVKVMEDNQCGREAIGIEKPEETINPESAVFAGDYVGTSGKKRIYYGNQYNQLQDSIVYSAPQINDFTCYRNVPCHQVCFYDTRLFLKRAYEPKYRVRADYEHFLYSIYEEKAEGIAIPVIVASYEGGGFSETRENRQRSAMEHKEITEKYLGAKKVFQYRCIMWLTLAPLRTKIAESPALSGAYNSIKNTIYKIMRR